MRTSPLVTGALWLLLYGADPAAGDASDGSSYATVSTPPGPSSTKLVTRTESATLVWTTPPGSTSGIKTPYSQKFTAMFSAIAEPMSGKIGLGYISGTYGSERHYPIQTAAAVSSIYSGLSSNTDVYNYTGPAVQELNTDKSGHIVPASWATVVALGGNSVWYGPTYSQNSNDLTGWSATTGVYSSYTGGTDLGQGTSALTTDTVAGAVANAPQVTSSSSTTQPAAAAAAAQSTTSSTTLPPGAVPSTTSTLPPGVAATTSSTTLPPGAAATTSSTTLPPGAAATTSSTTLPPGAVATTSSTTPGAAVTTTSLTGSTTILPETPTTTTTAPAPILPGGGAAGNGAAGAAGAAAPAPAAAAPAAGGNGANNGANNGAANNNGNAAAGAGAAAPAAGANNAGGNA